MNRPNKGYQTEDGVIWHSRSVAVTGIVLVIVKEDVYVLLTKRAETMEDLPGRWCLPCGYLDWDETIEDATIREVREETGFNISSQSPFTNGDGDFSFYPNIYISSDPLNNRQNVSIASAYLYEKAELPKINTTEETSEVEWCKADVISIAEKNLAFKQAPMIRYAIGMMTRK